MISFTSDCLAAANGRWLTDAPERPRRGNQPQSIRIFDNRWLEAISRAHPITPAVWFGPCIAASLWVTPGKLGIAATATVVGVLFFSFFEYALHRFVFHGLIHLAAGDARLRFVAFMVHGYHHEFPNDRSRLVMPPMISWPLAFGFAGVFWVALGAVRAVPGLSS